jgi:hypothetical protein
MMTVKVNTQAEKEITVFDMEPGEVAFLIQEDCGVVCLSKRAGSSKGKWLLLRNSQRIDTYCGDYGDNDGMYKIRKLREGESFTVTFSGE